MSAIFVYVTAPSRSDADAIARRAVTDRIAACANILPAMTSVYHWDGQVQSADECVVILKTRDTLYAAVEACVRELHPHKNPCIAALPVATGSAPFLQWIMDETKP